MKLISKTSLIDNFERWDFEMESKQRCFTAGGIIVHNSNARVGLVLENNEEGEAVWTIMAGSHGVRRKEFARVENRFRIQELVDVGIDTSGELVGRVFNYNGRYWQIESVFDHVFKVPGEEEEQIIPKCQCFEVRKSGNEWDVVWKRSDYWEYGITEQTTALLNHLLNLEWPEQKHAIIIYGEIYGDVQDMKYGMPNAKAFRAFDISINNQYLDFDSQIVNFSIFQVPVVPLLYRGPFITELLEEYTTGPTTLCSAESAGAFKGREGVVVKPVREIYCPVLKGRRILKSVSADYLARKKGTEFH